MDAVVLVDSSRVHIPCFLFEVSADLRLSGQGRVNMWEAPPPVMDMDYYLHLSVMDAYSPRQVGF